MRAPLRDPGWLAAVVVAGAALAVAAGVLATRLTTPTDHAVIRTEAWAWTSDGVTIEPTDLEGPFLLGDVVVAMDGRPIAAWVEGAIGLGPPNPPLDDPIAVDVIRAGATVRLTAHLAPFPLERLRGAPLGVAAFGTAVFALALTLVWRRPRSIALRLLLVAAAANIADITAWETGLEPVDLARGGFVLVGFAAGSIFNLVFWSSIVHLLAVYPVRSSWLVRTRWAVAAIYLGPIAAFLALAGIARLAGGTTLDWVDRLASCLGLVASAMLVVIVLSTFLGYRRASPTTRRSVRLVAIALVTAAAATFGLLTAPIVLTGTTLVPRGVVSAFALIVPLALAVAVVRDRLFQVALISRSRERIVAAREDERRRLRRDLHDGLAPSLAAVGLKLDLVRGSVRNDPDAAERSLDEARHEVRAVIAEIRRMSRELRPPALDTLGLLGAIRQQADALSGPAGSGPRFTVEGDPALPALPAAVEVAAYRITVEAMMNVVRHAAATTCAVHLALVGDELEIAVSDDGRGLAGSPSGVGLRAMQERAVEIGGDVTIVAGSEGGTHLSARLPVDRSALVPARP
jgi:signal transduction histidine kinase